MKKPVVVGSALTAAALCAVVSAGIAFAVTPEDAVNDLISDRTDVERIFTIETPVEHISDADAGDMAASYERLEHLLRIIGVSGDGDGLSDDPHNARNVGESTFEARSNADDAPSAAEVSRQDGSDQVLYSTDVLMVNGKQIPYVGSYQTQSAPSATAGLWLGSDDVDDGTWGYFIGHNPGVFAPVASLLEGSPVTVVDYSGDSHTYHVVKRFDVNAGSTWDQVAADVTGYGESIILQTCINGGAQYRIVVAA